MMPFISDPTLNLKINNGKLVSLTENYVNGGLNAVISEFEALTKEPLKRFEFKNW